jgi:hypothetical protein
MRGQIEKVSRPFSVAAAVMVVIISIGNRSASAADDSRTWRDSTGKFEIKATLVKQEAGAIQLKRDDGRLITVPIDRLSKEDREHLESLRKPNPFEVDEGLKSPAAASLVMAVANQAGGPQWSPGFVFYREGDKSYVLVNHFEPRINATTRVTRESTGEIAFHGTDARVVVPADSKAKSAVPQIPPETITLIWESPQGTRKVKGERVLTLKNHGKTILSALTKDLPAPLTPSKAKVEQGMPVTVIGFQIDGLVDPPTFTRIEKSASIKSVSQDQSGNVVSLQIEAPEIARLQNAIVLTTQGDAVGCCTTLASASGSGNPLDRVTAMPVHALAKVREPHAIHYAAAPRSGDARQIEWEFVAYIADPFGKLREPTLLVRRQHNIPDGLAPAERNKIEEQAARDAKEVKLTKGAPSAEVARRIMGHENAQYATTWVARVTLENVGGEPVHNFQLQLRDRANHEFPASAIVYHSTPDPFGERAAPPDIPGLDGMPLDMPRPVKDAKGGWRLTSSVTEGKSQRPHQAIRLPKPQSSERSVAGKKSMAGGYSVVELDLPAPPGEVSARPTRSQVPLAFSPDGKWLYLVDETDVLRKINTADLKEALTLELGSSATDLSWSKAGLLLAFRQAHAHWVVNADTLAVVREMPMFEARSMAGSPATTTGFALGTFFSAEAQGGTALAMIDFAEGKLLHELRGVYNGHTLQVDGKPFLNEPYFGVQMSADGKRLFLGGSALHRLRIDGTDLALEQSSAQLGSGNLSHLTLSNDGKRTALFTSPHRIVVLDTQDLSAPKLTLDLNDHVRAVAFDDKSGNIFVGHSLTVTIFGPRGAKLGFIGIPRGEVRRLLMHPSGESLVAWSGDTACLIDVKNLAASKDTP